MAVNVYPSTIEDNWIQIATTTPTSGTTVSFTSIPSGYRKLWLVTSNDPVTSTGGATFGVTVNSLSAVNSYTFFCAQGTSASAFFDLAEINQNVNTATAFAFDLIFTNKTPATPSASFIGGLGANTNAREISSGRIPGLTTAITQIDLTLSANAISGASTGTLELYGTY